MAREKIVFTSLGGAALVYVNTEMLSCVEILRDVYQKHSMESGQWSQESWQEVQKRVQTLSSKVARRRKRLQLSISTKPVNTACGTERWLELVSTVERGKLEQIYYACFQQQLEKIGKPELFQPLLEEVQLPDDISLVHLISEIWDMLSGNSGSLQYNGLDRMQFVSSSIRFSGRLKSSDTDAQILLGLEQAIASNKQESLERLNENVRMTGSLEVGIGISLLSEGSLRQLLLDFLLSSEDNCGALAKYAGGILFNDILCALGYSGNDLEKAYQTQNPQSFLIHDQQYEHFMSLIASVT